METSKKPPRGIVPLENKIEALKLLNNGAKPEDLAKTYGVQPGTILKWFSQRKTLKKLHGKYYKRPKNQLKMPVFLSVAQKVQALDEIDNGATYEELAEKLNVRPNTIHMWDINRKTLLNSFENSGSSVKRVAKRKKQVSESNDEPKKAKSEELPETKTFEEDDDSPFNKLPIPMEAKLAALQKIRDGATRAEVAKEYNVSENTLYKWKFNKKLRKMLYSKK